MKRHSQPLHGAAAVAALLAAFLGTAAVVSGIRSACAATENSAKQATITISHYLFRPAILTVEKGATVVWSNKDDDVHTIKSRDGPEGFRSPALESGSRFEFTFHRAGTYHYVCSVHPYMHGVIVVR